jgi:hypothetical protein
MGMRKWIVVLVPALAGLGRPATAAAQAPGIIGTWQADLKDQNRKDAPRTVVVRNDSSASYGTETVRWRLKPDSIMLALGGEWVTYRLQLKGTRLTLSGGDLVKPISLTRVGPPSIRPDSIKVPPDPDVGT